MLARERRRRAVSERRQERRDIRHTPHADATCCRRRRYRDARFASDIAIGAMSVAMGELL